MLPAEAEISLGIPSESSLCAKWIAKDPRLLHVDIEDSGQTGHPGWSESLLGVQVIFVISFVLIWHKYSNPPQQPHDHVYHNSHTANFITEVCGCCFGIMGASQHLSRHTTKPTKWHVRAAKTQISLGIHPDWSESSLCAQWVAKDLRFLRTDSEDSDQTGRMPWLIWVFAGRTDQFVLSWGGSFLNFKFYSL